MPCAKFIVNSPCLYTQPPRADSTLQQSGDSETWPRQDPSCTKCLHRFVYMPWCWVFCQDPRVRLDTLHELQGTFVDCPRCANVLTYSLYALTLDCQRFAGNQPFGNDLWILWGLLLTSTGFFSFFLENHKARPRWFYIPLWIWKGHLNRIVDISQDSLGRDMAKVSQRTFDTESKVSTYIEYAVWGNVDIGWGNVDMCRREVHGQLPRLCLRPKHDTGHEVGNRRPFTENGTEQPNRHVVECLGESKQHLSSRSRFVCRRRSIGTQWVLGHFCGRGYDTSCPQHSLYVSFQGFIGKDCHTVRNNLRWYHKEEPVPKERPMCSTHDIVFMLLQREFDCFLLFRIKRELGGI